MSRWFSRRAQVVVIRWKLVLRGGLRRMSCRSGPWYSTWTQFEPRRPSAWSCLTCQYSFAPNSCLLVFTPSPPLNNIPVTVIVWWLRGNIIRTAVCWIVWHNVHSQQHTFYVSSSYSSNRLGLSHWDPYAVHRGGCLELYYCNMVELFWWDSSLIFDDQLVSFSALMLLVWVICLVKFVPEMTYYVSSGTLNPTHSLHSLLIFSSDVSYNRKNRRAIANLRWCRACIVIIRYALAPI